MKIEAYPLFKGFSKRKSSHPMLMNLEKYIYCKNLKWNSLADFEKNDQYIKPLKVDYYLKYLIYHIHYLPI